MKPERINLEGRIAWIVICLIATPIALVGLYAIAAGGGPGNALAVGIVALFVGGLLALVSWVAVVVGPDHLLLNIPAGTLEIRRGRSGRRIRLDELGALTITPYKRLQKSRSATWHKLEAAGLPNVILLEATDPTPVVDLKVRIDTAVAASVVRPILAIQAEPRGSTFREAPDLATRLATAVPDASRRKAAVQALLADYDEGVRKRAAELANTLSSPM